MRRLCPCLRAVVNALVTTLLAASSPKTLALLPPLRLLRPPQNQLPPRKPPRMELPRLILCRVRPMMSRLRRVWLRRMPCWIFQARLSPKLVSVHDARFLLGMRSSSVPNPNNSCVQPASLPCDLQEATSNQSSGLCEQQRNNSFRIRDRAVHPRHVLSLSTVNPRIHGDPVAVHSHYHVSDHRLGPFAEFPHEGADL